MGKGRLETVRHYLRWAARIFISVFSFFWFVFALLSGAGQLGGGLRGVMLNSPNALPWLLLLVLVFVAWRWELVGGLLILVMGLSTVLMFGAFRQLFVLFAISLPLILAGAAFVFSWCVEKGYVGR